MAIVGPNGAGKTTLIKCLDKILIGGTGRIEVFGRPLEKYRQKELARLISYVPQADERVSPFTVEQFVLMGRYPYLSPFSPVSRKDREVVCRSMEQTDTPPRSAPRRPSGSGWRCAGCATPSSRRSPVPRRFPHRRAGRRGIHDYPPCWVTRSQ